MSAYTRSTADQSIIDFVHSEMPKRLYKGSGGSVTCGWDGYQNTKGRHAGIDCAKDQGSSIYTIYAVADGYVVE